MASLVNTKFSGVSVPGKDGKKRLTRREKAEKYGKRFKRDYLEFNKKWLDGDMSKFKEDIEQREERRKEYLSRIDPEDKEALKLAKRRRVHLENNITDVMEEKRAIRASRRIPVNANTSLDDMRRRNTAIEAAEQDLVGYVKMLTNHGILNIEVFCNKTPTAAENFLGLCQQGYYDGTLFLKSFSGRGILGGDPTLTGEGGQSIWGDVPFEDELKPPVPIVRGTLVMASNGPHTNRSQFWISYGENPEEITGGTVFGRVVGGLAVLNAIEEVPVSDLNRPKSEIRIEKTLVLWDPLSFLQRK